MGGTRQWLRGAPVLLAPLVLLAACTTPVSVTLLFAPDVISVAQDVNAAGVVVGDRVEGERSLAWRAVPGRDPELLDPPAENAAGGSVAEAVNREGVIAGRRNLTAVLWYPDGRSVTLPEPTRKPDAPPLVSMYALDLNDQGLVVGAASGSGEPEADSLPVVWEPDTGRATVLETMACATCIHGQVAASTEAVNNQGQIVGLLYPPGAARRPVIWSRRGAGWGPAEPLPVPADTSAAYAHDINDAGTIVGALEWPEPSQPSAVMWSGPLHTRSVIDPPAGATSASALAINNAGVVVGQLRRPAGPIFSVFRWRPGDRTARQLPGPGGLNFPAAIGDGGTIVGSASPDFLPRAARWDG
jgi:uncharacterized membrane protein